MVRLRRLPFPAIFNYEYTCFSSTVIDSGFVKLKAFSPKTGIGNQYVYYDFLIIPMNIIKLSH